MNEARSKPRHGFRGRLRRFRPRTRPRYRGPSFNQLVPNLLTLLGLCSGLTAIRFALDGGWPQAGALLVLAAVIDGLDGRIARLLNATSRFGMEFDSLSDFLCFGVAPALLLYLWALHDNHGLGFMPCLLFAVCSALRLARFNAMAISAIALGPEAPKPAYAQNFFTGVPAPAGAAVVLVPLFASMAVAEWDWPQLAAALRHKAVVVSFLVGGGLLMVSTLPTWSFKNFKVPAEYVLPLLLGLAAFLALLVSEPWAALAACGVLYLGMLPFSLRSYVRLKREAEALLEPAPENQPA